MRLAGSGVMPKSKVRFLMRQFFDGPNGADGPDGIAMKRIDCRIDRLPVKVIFTHSGLRSSGLPDTA
jgi:hypothetical protein